jgi:hypothetical protein
MNYEKARRVDDDDFIDDGVTPTSNRLIVEENDGSVRVYAPMPDEYRRRTQELASEWQCSEWEAINAVWKCGTNPPHEGESEVAYAERLKSVPDAPVIYVTGKPLLRHDQLLSKLILSQRLV